MEMTEENQSPENECEQVDRQYEEDEEEVFGTFGSVHIMLGRGAKFRRAAPRTDTRSRHLDMGDHVVVYPEHHQGLCSDDKAYRQEDTNVDEEAQTAGVYNAIGDTPMQQSQTDWRPLADAAANKPNLMYTSGTGATPMQQPQTDWRSLADAAAKIPNPMYNTGTGATPMQQSQTDWRSLADAAANIPNPMYNTGTGARNGQHHQTDTTSQADASANVPNQRHTALTDIDECIKRPCLHGRCVNYPGGYRCTCSRGWTGQNCRQDINECTRNPCQHGSCVNTNGGYRCNCQQGWTGTNCHQAPRRCQSGWSEYNNHCYKFFKDKVSWDAANGRCKQHGANLASVGSAGENNFIARLISDGGVWFHIWFGLRRNRNGQWKWTDGSPVSYKNWARGQPRLLNDRAFMHYKDCDSWLHCESGKEKKGQWSTIRACSLQFPYVCKTLK
ncbi:PREDICTED: versican core protein-like [Branchiostoma belcheri]|uniref:Versican core protein-like n=1 Tax=Branchiostoma belcheri TaxID=7741 RepID=A0A6P4ZW06_BRABE|nr:PREDICTED: versican core protein-like [Branchiostoma belcheri]